MQYEIAIHTPGLGNNWTPVNDYGGKYLSLRGSFDSEAAAWARLRSTVPSAEDHYYKVIPITQRDIGNQCLASRS